MFQFSTVKSLLLSLTTYTVCILDQCDISNSNSTTSVVVAEVEKIELLEKKSKEGKTLEQLMFPDDRFNETLKDTTCEVESNVESDTKTEKRKRTLQRKSKKSLLKCNICDYKTTHRINFKRHKESVHQEIKPFKCSICDFESAWEPNLKKHIESVHEGIKPFKCHICEYKGRQKSDLKTHIESVHDGIKPFECNICGYKAAFKVRLKKHIESVHEGIKPFKCNICDYETTEKSNLKRHIESIHEGIKKLVTCDFPGCGKTFYGSNVKRSYENHQKKHLKPKKKQESKCDFCNKEYKNLSQHKKRYCLENRDPDTGTWKSSDIKDPLFVMPKPPIELDWSWRDKLKKEKMAKVKPSSDTVTNSTTKEKIVDLAEENKTLPEQPNIHPGIKVTTSSNLNEEKTMDSTQESKILQKSNIRPVPKIKIECEKTRTNKLVVLGKE